MPLRPYMALLSCLLACEGGDEPTTCGPVQRADYSECMEVGSLESTCDADSCAIGSTPTRTYSCLHLSADPLALCEMHGCVVF